MTTALFRKELRELRPWAVLSLFVGLVELADLLLSQIDLQPASATLAVLGRETGVALFIMAFSIGTGLLVREVEDGTLAFLDGLPVSRARIFLVKHAVTCLVLFVAPVVNLVVVIGAHLLSRGSLDSELRADIVLGRFALQLAAIVSGVVLGAAMGWLRSLTWLCVGALATGLLVLVEDYPRAACLSPVSFLQAVVTSGGLDVDRESLLVQSGLACVAALFAWWRFSRAGQPRSALDLSSRPVISALVSLFTALVVVAAIALYANQEDDEEAADAASEGDDEREGAAHFAKSPPASMTTKHLRFSYPATHAEAATRLSRDADAIFERAHALLGVPPGPSIDVDCSGSIDNTEGTAFYGRVRISLISAAPRKLLAHEITHVVAQRLAGGDRAALWDQALVLNEGLATWVERHFEDAAPPTHDADASVQAPDADVGAQVGASDPREAGRLVLAALHARRELLATELFDYQQLALVRDDSLKYPAGEAVIEAIVRVHGAQALPRLLRAFADKSLPQDLRAHEVWQATFQLAGMDLDRAIDEMFRAVARDAEVRAAAIAALPRLRVRLVRDPDDSDYVGVQVLSDPETAKPEGLRVRFKPEPGSPFSDYETLHATTEVPVWRSVDDIQHGRVCVQPGVHVPPDQILYEPWACLPAADAEAFRP